MNDAKTSPSGDLFAGNNREIIELICRKLHIFIVIFPFKYFTYLRK